MKVMPDLESIIISLLSPMNGIWKIIEPSDLLELYEHRTTHFRR